MAISQNPITGQMRKSYANVNTYTHKGQNVISAKAFNRKDANTNAQQFHRASFKLVVDAFTALGGYAEKSFPQRNIKQSAYNVFMAANLPNAIDSTGDVPLLDYSKLVVAKGSMLGVEFESATLGAEGIVLQCRSLIEYPKAFAHDVVVALVKRAGRAVKAFSTVRGDDETLQIEIAMPGISKDDVEFIYVYVLSKDGSKASNSIYVQLT